MGTPDKRFSPRLTATASDYVVYVEGSGRVRDISLGGMFIEDRQPFPVGTVFGFTLSLGTWVMPARGLRRWFGAELANLWSYVWRPRPLKQGKPGPVSALEAPAPAGLPEEPVPTGKEGA